MSTVAGRAVSCEACGAPLTPGTASVIVDERLVCGDPGRCVDRMRQQEAAAMASGIYRTEGWITGPAPAAAEKPAGDSPAAGAVPLKRGEA